MYTQGDDETSFDACVATTSWMALDSLGNNLTPMQWTIKSVGVSRSPGLRAVGRDGLFEMGLVRHRSAILLPKFPRRLSRDVAHQFVELL